MSIATSITLGIGAISMFMLYWIYDGYGRFLRVLAPSAKPAIDPPEEELPSVAVMLTVHNEEDVIEGRLSNLIELEYPRDRFRIVVTSDRSTDSTDDIVERFARQHDLVQLVSCSDSTGKSDAQNRALRSVSEEVVIFTDAETRLDAFCIRALAGRFIDPQVGMVDAELTFDREANAISEGQGWYWSYERMLRRLEGRLGILAVGSGACMAVRRTALDPLREGVGEDCQVPLMVVRNGLRVVQEPRALAVDNMPSQVGSEIRTRARMTARNWRGTFDYPSVLFSLRRPLLAFGLWSHKVLRWLSPIFLLLFMGSLVAVGSLEEDLRLLLIAPVAIVFFAVLGGFGLSRDRISRTMFSFVLANVGFLLGLWYAWTGASITRYGKRGTSVGS